MGESIAEAIVSRVIKPSQSNVKVDEEILELETDKVNQVLHSPGNGVLELIVKEGDTVKIGQVIGKISEGQSVQKAEVKEPEKTIDSKPLPVKEESLRITTKEFLQNTEVPVKNETRLLRVSSGEPTESNLTPQKGVVRKKLSRLRQVIGERLVAAQNTSAMLTTFNEVDLSQLIEIREKHREEFQAKHNVKLGYMSFFVKASVSALHVFPNVASFIDGDEVVSFPHLDISIAVSTDRGLVVPVLRKADQLSFPEIEREIGRFSKLAREGGLTSDDLKGGCYTITNGGVFGSLLSTPMINPPQSAILGMHTIQKRAVVVEDQIVIRPMMYLALTYDHRLIDGKEAVSFLVHLKQCLEDPYRIPLEM